MQFIIFAIYVVLSVSGVVLVKLGTENPLSFAAGKGRFALSVGYVAMIGLLCYICSFLIYMSLIRKYDLSYIVPMSTGAVYLLTLAASIGVFHEKISFLRIAGSIFILAGIVLVNVKST